MSEDKEGVEPFIFLAKSLVFIKIYPNYSTHYSTQDNNIFLRYLYFCANAENVKVTLLTTHTTHLVLPSCRGTHHFSTHRTGVSWI